MDNSDTPPAQPPIAGADSFNSDPLKKRVLMVEDDDALAVVYINRIKAEGIDVRRVVNGEDALATAISYKPHLILLDVMIPRVSGFDVLDIIRNTPETANIRVIILTALSQEADIKKATDLGVDDYLVKSEVPLNDIVKRIKELVSEL
jgi:DNA-binding response OmpR family regulator